MQGRKHLTCALIPVVRLVFQFIRSCKDPSANKVAVPFLCASREKSPRVCKNLVVLLAE